MTKKHISILVSLVLLFSFTGVSFAKTTDICSKISDFSLRTADKIANQEKRLEQKRKDIVYDFDKRWEKRDESLLKKRTELFKKRQEYYAKIQERAETDEQKKAVESFKTVIESAILLRQQAIDTAIKVFRQEIEQAKIQRQSSVDVILSTFKLSVKAAYERARIDCSTSMDEKTIRQTLIDSLKTAREKFRQDKQSIEKLGSQVSEIVKTRNTAVKRALNDFKITVEQERNKLKEAFK